MREWRWGVGTLRSVWGGYRTILQQRAGGWLVGFWVISKRQVSFILYQAFVHRSSGVVEGVGNERVVRLVGNVYLRCIMTGVPKSHKRAGMGGIEARTRGEGGGHEVPRLKETRTRQS